jgi:hypothetical protein
MVAANIHSHEERRSNMVSTMMISTIMISAMRAAVLSTLHLALGLTVMAAALPNCIAAAPVSSYKVVAEFPHSTDSYTKGFFYHDGLFYEGTGQRATRQSWSSSRKAAKSCNDATCQNNSSARASSIGATISMNGRGSLTSASSMTVSHFGRLDNSPTRARAGA